MKNTVKSLSLLSLALILGACGNSAPTATAPVNTNRVSTLNTQPTEQTRWFVELTGDPTALSVQSVSSQQASFRAQAAQQGIRYQEVRSFQTLFNGFSVQASEAEINRIGRLPGVLGVYPVGVIQKPQVERNLNADLRRTCSRPST